jgi:hypothetical protein
MPGYKSAKSMMGKAKPKAKKPMGAKKPKAKKRMK